MTSSANREKFELWAQDNGLSVQRHSTFGCYWNQDTDMAWKAWSYRSKVDLAVGAEAIEKSLLGDGARLGTMHLPDAVACAKAWGLEGE